MTLMSSWCSRLRTSTVTLRVTPMMRMKTGIRRAPVQQPTRISTLSTGSMVTASHSDHWWPWSSDEGQSSEGGHRWKYTSILNDMTAVMSRAVIRRVRIGWMHSRSCANWRIPGVHSASRSSLSRRARGIATTLSRRNGSSIVSRSRWNVRWVCCNKLYRLCKAKRILSSFIFTIGFVAYFFCKSWVNFNSGIVFKPIFKCKFNWLMQSLCFCVWKQCCT